MMAIENPIFNLENLSLLKNKIEQNEAGQNEFDDLMFFLSLVGIKSDFVYNEMKSNGINSFEEYKLLSKQNPIKKEVKIFKFYILGVLEFISARLNK